MSSYRIVWPRLARVSSANKRCHGQHHIQAFSSVSGEPAEQSNQVPGTSNTHFGFQQVHSEAKKGMVKGVFSSVAHNYDVMNDLMSAGLHRLWKDEFVNMLGISTGLQAGSPPPTILDVAGGTGDISFRMAEQLRPYLGGDKSMGNGDDGAIGDVAGDTPLITVSDINPEMLEVGRQRATDRFSSETLNAMRFVQADAEALPFGDNSFHLYTIAFGLRNVTDTDKALREAHRVLKPGGRFMCLEFSRVPMEPLQKAYDWYSFNVIPTLGEVVARDRDAYQYLVESIRMFPGQEELEGRMSTAGFKIVSHKNLTAGVVAVHSGFKLPRNRDR